jgi:hypothetical protein
MQQAFWTHYNPIHLIQDYAHQLGASNENQTGFAVSKPVVSGVLIVRPGSSADVSQSTGHGGLAHAAIGMPESP